MQDYLQLFALKSLRIIHSVVAICCSICMFMMMGNILCCFMQIWVLPTSFTPIKVNACLILSSFINLHSALADEHPAFYMEFLLVLILFPVLPAAVFSVSLALCHVGANMHVLGFLPELSLPVSFLFQTLWFVLPASDSPHLLSFHTFSSRSASFYTMII